MNDFFSLIIHPLYTFIFVKVTVLNVEKLDSNSTWKVRYRLFNGGHIADAVHFTTANFVILAGGSLGSTEVLLRSREAHGLLLSPTLGKTFFGKGDDLGYSFRGDKNAGAIATAFDNPGKSKHPFIDLHFIRIYFIFLQA